MLFCCQNYNYEDQDWEIMGRIMGKYYCTLLKSNNNSSSLFIVNNIIPIDLSQNFNLSKINNYYSGQMPRPLWKMASKDCRVAIRDST